MSSTNVVPLALGVKDSVDEKVEDTKINTIRQGKGILTVVIEYGVAQEVARLVAPSHTFEE